MFTLDHSTLFYHTLSDALPNKRKRDEAIQQWSSDIPTGNKPVSRTINSVISRARSTTPSLAGNTSRSSASILTDNIKIISHKTSKMAKVKPNPMSSVEIYDNGGLSDNDEMRGEERQAAFASPLKGKEQATSNVRKNLLFDKRSNFSIAISNLLSKLPQWWLKVVKELGMKIFQTGSTHSGSGIISLQHTWPL